MSLCVHWRLRDGWESREIGTGEACLSEMPSVGQHALHIGIPVDVPGCRFLIVPYRLCCAPLMELTEVQSKVPVDVHMPLSECLLFSTRFASRPDPSSTDCMRSYAPCNGPKVPSCAADSFPTLALLGHDPCNVSSYILPIERQYAISKPFVVLPSSLRGCCYA